MFLKEEKCAGEPVKPCGKAWEKPAYCLLWPIDPTEKLPEDCGFTWRKIE